MHAAFLRAVNLGSTRKVSSAQLRAAFEEMGFTEVATFRTSGNVVFDAPRQSAARLTARIERGLEEALGFEVPIFLRAKRELLKLAAAEPFPADEVERSNGKPQVMLLGSKPNQAARKEVLARATDSDRLAFGARELFWLPSGGTLESELDRNAIAQRLGPATMRTKGTIELLAAKYFA